MYRFSDTFRPYIYVIYISFSYERINGSCKNKTLIE